MDLFAQRVAVLATMHRKEEAIAPLLQAELDIKTIVPADFNTDRFGTFTREVKRTGDQLAAARLKAQAGMQRLGATLGLASEGSFGPHPAIPYLPCNRELVVLIDATHDLEIVGYDFSIDTNYRHQVVDSLDAALAFAQQAKFPTHGLVVMPTADQPDPDAMAQNIVKGIVTESALRDAVQPLLQRQGCAHLETDMRAMVNPTRMQAIARATQDLIRKLRCLCPRCGTPGFDVGDRKPGLPCGLCYAPTALTLTAVYQCQTCGFTQDVLYPDGIELADPAQCQYCNP